MLLLMKRWVQKNWDSSYIWMVPFLMLTTGAWFFAAFTLLTEAIGIPLPWGLGDVERGACNAPPGC